MEPLNDTVEDTLVNVLQRTGPCSLDNLMMQISNHDWNVIFATVDRMSRDGVLVLYRIPRLGYQISLPAPHAANEKAANTVNPYRCAPVRFCVGCGYLCDEIEPTYGQTQWMDAHEYLTKHGLRWGDLDRTSDTCPPCSRVFQTTAHRTSVERKEMPSS
ncbi:MAG: hypothetical protein ABI604_10350 [Nitrospirota bacterium]